METTTTTRHRPRRHDSQARRVSLHQLPWRQVTNPYPPIQPLTLFPDRPYWYVLDVGDTGCEKYGWPISCDTAYQQTVDRLIQEDLQVLENSDMETDNEN